MFIVVLAILDGNRCGTVVVVVLWCSLSAENIMNVCGQAVSCVSLVCAGVFAKLSWQATRQKDKCDSRNGSITVNAVLFGSSRLSGHPFTRLDPRLTLLQE
jgi:hypothetical protein